ncbi:hypothetical protein F4801DRAFT_531332 [Xylaria longipes]|nr:hypothetical protein F4801DRAFT_531332 [Xylaria longipes]
MLRALCINSSVLRVAFSDLHASDMSFRFSIRFLEMISVSRTQFMRCRQYSYCVLGQVIQPIRPLLEVPFPGEGEGGVRSFCSRVHRGCGA